MDSPLSSLVFSRAIVFDIKPTQSLAVKPSHHFCNDLHNPSALVLDLQKFLLGLLFTTSLHNPIPSYSQGLVISP